MILYYFNYNINPVSLIVYYHIPYNNVLFGSDNKCGVRSEYINIMAFYIIYYKLD